jgi:hypothetical protein
MATVAVNDATQVLNVQNQPDLRDPNDVLEMATNDAETRPRRRDSARSGEEDGRPSPNPSDNQLRKEGSSSAGGVTLEEEEDAYDSCCICFDGKEYVLTSCCHLFCLPCITRWIEISNTCPICRNEFETGVELYNLIGTVEDTIRAIKEVHKRKREQEAKRRERALALQAESAGSGSSAATWGIFHQVMDLLFPASVDGERMNMSGRMALIEQDEDPATLAPHLNLTRVNLNALANGRQSTQNVTLAHTTGRHNNHHGHHQLNVAPSFPFLSFCCLPQPSPSVAMSPVFERLSRGNRIH